MVKSRTKLLDRVLAVILAVIMVVAMIPMSTLTAFALSYEAGGDCQEATCGGKLQWVENSESDGKHYLVCNNEECVYSAIEEAYVNHNEGEGEADCLICNPPHTHGEFVYSLENEGTTLVATCGSAGTCDLDGKKVSITIVAPANLEYDGSVKAATISDADEWKATTGNDAPEITYSAEPKAVGTYTASITVDETTASVEFTIVKGTPVFTVPTGLTAKYDQTLADVDLPDGFAWEDETAKVGAVGEQSFEATYTPVDTDNYNVVNDIAIKITVGKAASDIAAPSKSGEATHTSITLEAVTPTAGDGTVEYGYAENEGDEVTNWQSETTFNGLEGSKTYYFYARVNETENYAAAISTGMPISTLDKKNGDITLSIEGWIYGDEAKAPVYEVIEGEYETAKIKVVYATKGGSDWSPTVPTKAGEYTVKVICDANAVWAEAVKTYDFKIEQKELTIEWGSTTFVYNAQAQKPTATITAGIVGNDDVAVVVSGAETDVNGGENNNAYTATVSLSGETAANYKINSDQESKQFTITTKEVVITWSNTSLTHNQNEQKPTAVINDGEIFSGDVVNVVVGGEQKSPGTYTATATLTGVDANNYHIQASLVNCAFGILNHEIPAAPYTIVKADAEGKPTSEIANANENHWYNYDVCIVPKENYEISIQDNEDINFSEYLFVDSSKTDFTFYLRCNDRNCEDFGGYTGEIIVGDPDVGETFNIEKGKINIDKDSPDAYTKINEGTALDIFLETITFGIYHKDKVTVTLSGTDANSTVDHIYYYILEKNRLSNSDLFEKGEDIPSWTEGTTVTVNADNDYVVYAKVVDKAGNVSYASTKDFVFDATKPAIKVSFDNNSSANEKYFMANRTATVEITEHNFDADEVKLTVTENGSDTSANYSLNWSSNGDVHTATVLFKNEADYTFAISCTDKAGNANEPVVYVTDSVATNEFTIDKSAPTDLTITINDVSVLGTSSIAFDKFYGGAVTVKLGADCDISGLESLKYQKVASVTDYNENGTWLDYDAQNGIVINPSEKFVIYFRAEDRAGNVSIVNSTGIVVDDKKPTGETNAPEIDIVPVAPNIHGYYNGDVIVNLKVVDPKHIGADASANGYYSGLNKITYKIYTTDTDAVEEGVLLDLTSKTEGAEFDADNLIKAWAGKINIAASEFNSNNVIVVITAVDNAGNERTSTTVAGDIKIDITPSKIEVTYNNNDGDTSFTESTYFKADRTATIVVTERNFNPELFKVEIANTDGYIPEIGEWKTVTAGGNGDETTHTAQIVFNKDGDYTFAVSCVDKALNPNVDPDPKDSLAPWAFTIDKTAPVVNVAYDNNDVLNGNYYKKQRIATITVTEHNFETGRIKISLKATDDGVEAVLPVVSNWTPNGDVHTATITYAADSLYVFDFDYNDKAGNATADIAEQTFYVDKTNPVLTIEKIVDESANNDEGNIGFVMTATDTNFDVFTPVLTAVVKNGDTFETKQLEVGEITDIKNGKVFTVTNIDADGIYRITCTIVDKAGNAYSEVTLENADGSKYVEQRAGEDTLVTFSVNRDGSTFEIDEDTVEVVDQYYIQNLKNDIVVIEVNADPLKEYTVTLNGKELVKDTDYTVTEEGGNGAWMKYTYKVNKDLFAGEGEYKLVVASKDKADNDAFSDVKEAAIEFVVDRTAPVVTVSGIANDGRYQTDKQLVTLIPTDDGGALKTLIVNMVDEDGKVIKEVFNLTGEALMTELEANGGKITFEIAEGLYQNVQIICTDYATGDAEDTNTYETTIKNVSVSSSVFMIFWANKPLRWGTIGGVSAAVIALAVFIILKKKKRKNA